MAPGNAPENPGEGRGPPEDFPGKGRGRDEVPGNAPIEEVRDKLADILDDKIGEGQLGIRVKDSNGNVKDRLDTVRIKKLGSVECRPFEENGKKWSLKRKDKLPHNE